MAINFPTGPVVGQLFLGGELFYEWDGVAWNIVGGTANRMNFIDYVLTTGGTWVKPTGLKKLEVALVGGGGGSGGCAATIAAQSASAGGGGGAGVVLATYHDMSILTSHAYGIGTGGAGGAAGPNVGVAGVATTFKLLTAGGGGAGSGSIANGSVNAANGGTGGVATSTEPASCVVNLMPGGRGEQGVSVTHGNNAVPFTGPGGGNHFVPKDGGKYFLGAGTQAGIAGHFPGGGAEGSASSVSQAAAAGAAGAAGVIFMREWY